MKKIVKLSDGLSTNDRLIAVPNTAIGKGFDTEIIIRAHNTHFNGDHSIKIDHNKTVLNGRTKLLENVFPVTINTAQHLFINDNILGTYDASTGADSNAITVCNTPSTILPRSNPVYFRQRNVEYWCAGNGAINKTVLTSSYESHSTNTKLYNMIPFRLIKADESLSDEERALYKMEVIYPSTSNLYGYKGYYFKKIVYDTTISGINMKVDGIDYTPAWHDTATDLDATTTGIENSFKGSKTQQSYIDMTLGVKSEEFKEYFEVVDGSLGNAYISEIGLVCGLDCVLDKGITETVASLKTTDSDYATKCLYSEIYDSELFAHLTFDPYTVSRDNATIDFEYRVFA